ncbi:MAG: polysaccharide biosynthesis protein, partial [Butyrivibrio sp.]|nr:polysaccharide biosynthesis protein [Butyrivibrio sp.]
MKLERTKNATRGAFFGILSNIYRTLGPFVIRTLIIYYLGIEYVGLSGLFQSVLSVLNLSELGVGMAMVYSMYAAIAEDDDKKINAL